MILLFVMPPPTLPPDIPFQTIAAGDSILK